VTGRGKDRFTIRGLSADKRCSQAIPGSLGTTDVGDGYVPDDDYDESLLACDPIGSRRDYVQSDPVRRPPRPRAVRRIPDMAEEHARRQSSE
jgi:hypothetical protein